MGTTRRDFLASVGAAGTLALAACRGGAGDEPASSSSPAKPEVDLTEFAKLAVDMDAWRYDEANDVYYQLGIPYCLSPASEALEALSLYVPGGYLKGKRHGSHYSCEVVQDAIVGRFTPATAPVMVPVNTGELSPLACPTKYSYRGLKAYLSQGCVYCYPGLRGRSAGYDSDGGTVFAGGSPWPVVDLKAAVRFLRYNGPVLPFDPERIFVFGFSAGAGVAAVVGASGGSERFDAYLEQIGAATHDSDGEPLDDSVAGVALWAPKTSFDVADAAYEWERGQWSGVGARADGTWTALLGDDLAESYGEWVGEAGLTDADGNALALDLTDTSIYGAGSYAEALLASVEGAATDFLSTTVFPYTEVPVSVVDPSFPGDPSRVAEVTEEEEEEDDASAGATDSDDTGSDASASDASGSEDGAAGSSSAVAPDESGAGDAALDASSSAPDGDAPAAPAAATSGEAVQAAEPHVVVVSGTLGAGGAGGVQVESTIYNSSEDYVAALNAGLSYPWITHNQTQDTVHISSLGQFFSVMAPATLGVGAFDDVDRSGTANQLFGLEQDDTAVHFSEMIGDCIRAHRDDYEQASGWSATYNTAWMHDLRLTSDDGEDVLARVQLMNPLFWLSPCYEGSGSATAARHWRVNVGLSDSEVPLCCAFNLSLALGAADGVSDVAFTPVWGKGHVLAEREGTPSRALVDWVVSSLTA